MARVVDKQHRKNFRLHYRNYTKFKSVETALPNVVCKVESVIKSRQYAFGIFLNKCGVVSNVLKHSLMNELDSRRSNSVLRDLIYGLVKKKPSTMKICC